jgi:hypothetical protein
VCLRLAAAADFQAPPPHAILGLAAWEVVEGELASPQLSAGFRFYVNPERPALYSVMRYRVRSGDASVKAPTEKFLWVEHPGKAVPIRCFELLVPETAAGSPAKWREMVAGTGEYLREMQTVMAVLAQQRRKFQGQGATR